MKNLVIMEKLLQEIEEKTICYNALAEQQWLKTMTFNTIAETRYANDPTIS